MNSDQEREAGKKFASSARHVWAFNLSMWAGLSGILMDRGWLVLCLVVPFAYGIVPLARWIELARHGAFYCKRCRRIKPMRDQQERMIHGIIFHFCASCVAEVDGKPTEGKRGRLLVFERGILADVSPIHSELRMLIRRGYEENERRIAYSFSPPRLVAREAYASLRP